MIFDIILVVILLLTAFIGLKTGLINMLGRLILLLLSLGLTLLVISPVIRFLSQISLLEPLADVLTHPVIKTFEQTAISVEEAVRQFALPPLLEQMMSEQLPEGSRQVADALPELSSALFQFVLTAIVFIFLLIVISLTVHLLTRLLTRVSDSLPVVGPLNHLGGFLVGTVFGLVVVNIVLLLAGLLSPYIPDLADQLRQSTLAGPLYLINFLVQAISHYSAVSNRISTP